MPGFLLEQLLLTKAYRLCRSLVLAFAALYVLMVAVNGIPYRGVGLGLLGFTLHSLRADLIDMASIESSRLLSYGLGAGTRPTRYALICEENGQATQAENAAGELQVRRQLVDNKSGSAYNGMIAGIDRGDAQPVFILSRFAPGGAKLCAVRQYWNQECTCGGQYKATERSRIPASDLFSPPKPLN